jgi:hypothetical protein
MGEHHDGAKECGRKGGRKGGKAKRKIAPLVRKCQKLL